MLDVCLLGTGGTMPLPRRWLTALITRFNGHSLLIDCGEGTQIAMKEAGISPNPIDIICFTHYHADHISGLPGLLLSMGNADRTDPVTLIGPRGLVRVVTALRTIAPELPFEIRMIEIEGQSWEEEHFGYQIQAFRVKHNVTCYGYSISIPRAGRFDAEAARRQEIPLKAWSRLQKGEIVEMDGKVYRPQMVMGPERKGIKLTYCTDSRPVPEIARAAAGSDLFICEGMYGDPCDEAKARKKKHMTFQEAAELAREARVGELWLTHFSPSLVGPGRFMDELTEIFPNASLGKDGRSCSLDFPEETAAESI